MPDPILLTPPGKWDQMSAQSLLDYARSLDRFDEEPSATAIGDSTELRAAKLLVRDTARNGWSVEVNTDSLTLIPAELSLSLEGEKQRIRDQELLRREEQLRRPSVHKFIKSMETPSRFGDQNVSIFSLMRDGRSLRADIANVATDGARSADLREIIDPYVQFVDSKARCEHTGLRLMDIWRYFRHTWANQYKSTPGRSLRMLIRDRAAPFDAVIGIATLGSAVMQLSERDRWIGWTPDQELERMASAPKTEDVLWLTNRIQTGLAEIYVDDLIEDGFYWPDPEHITTDAELANLRTEAAARREAHRRFGRKSDFSTRATDDETHWVERARSDLFRSKRCAELAWLLEAQRTLLPFLSDTSNAGALAEALTSAQCRRAVSGLVKRSKAASAGTEIADLTVCGAIPPYSHLIGGKLVSFLAVSPTAVGQWRAQYGGRASEIASSMAGRPIVRSSRLAYVGTTSLYGIGSSQYNRLKLPEGSLGNDAAIQFRELGKSKSYGSAHLSEDTVAALQAVSEQNAGGARVKSIFGEGVSPKLRKIREGIDGLGWPSGDLMKHGRHRIVYGVSLVGNLRRYLLGYDPEPAYLADIESGGVGAIAEWWTERWLRNRITSEEVLGKLDTHSTDTPIEHGARVLLPQSNDAVLFPETEDF